MDAEGARTCMESVSTPRAVLAASVSEGCAETAGQGGARLLGWRP